MKIKIGVLLLRSGGGGTGTEDSYQALSSAAFP